MRIHHERMVLLSDCEKRWFPGMSETVIGYATGANDMLQGLHTQAPARRFHLRNHKSET
jgi:hypothetical protein